MSAKSSFIGVISAVVTGSLIMLSCGGKTDEQKGTGEVEQTVRKSEDLAEKVTSLFPRNEELTGFERTSGVKSIPPVGLHDYLGDAADTFDIFAVKMSASADYRSTESDAQFSVDIHLHSNMSFAFGMYAERREASYPSVNVGTQGYIDAGSLSFFKDAYFVTVSGYARSDASDTAAVDLGRAIAAKIDGNPVFPAAIQLLPDEGKIANTEKYVPLSLLGHRWFSPAYTCRYQLGDSIATLAFLPRASTAELIQYKQLVKNRGNQVFEGQLDSLQVYFFDDDQHGRVIMTARPGRIAGVINTPDRDHGINLLQKLWASVDEWERK